MTIKKKRSPIVRALGFAAALILVVALMPFNAIELLSAFAAESIDAASVNYNYITIADYDASDSSNTSESTIAKGSTYEVRKAYIGNSSNLEIGSTSTSANTLSGTGISMAGSLNDVPDATLNSTLITVTFGGNTVVTSGDDGYSSDTLTFEADKVGTYTITYSYTYTVGTTSYTNTYDLTVECVVSSVSISIPTDGEYVLPSTIDLTLFNEAVSDGNRDSKIYIPTVEVTDEDGEEIDGVEMVANSRSNATSDKVVVVTAYGGVQSENLYSDGSYAYLTSDSEGVYIDSAVFSATTFGSNSDYVLTFSYYENGVFICSTTKTITVKDEYYTGTYGIVLNLETDWTDNGETGVENDLPVATAVTSDDTTPSGEEVDVAYKVEVRYHASGSTKYAALDTTLYGTDVVYTDTEGKTYLVDPTSFKPLEDGYYTFIYTITDFYGNSVSSAERNFEYSNITDETDPTPILYDAAEYKTTGTITDATEKFATRANANSVIVYAISVEDNDELNLSEATLVRKVMTSSTEKFTIEGYDAYNLVFNYYDTTDDNENNAYVDLQTNNYQIRKLISQTSNMSSILTSENTEIKSDADMLDFLKYYNTLIVIDNSNYAVIYNYFENIFTAHDATLDSADDMLAYVKAATEETLASLGFAYIDVDETFGASSSQTDIEDGMGTGYYYVHYIATDAAGNETDSSHRIYIVSSFTDETSPEITFSTTLKKAYTTGATITFTAPSATDTIDSNLSVKTLYRYLDSTGKNAITNSTLTGGEVLLNNDGEAATTQSLSWILDDLYAQTNESTGAFTRTDYEEYASDYANYLGTGEWNDGTTSYDMTYKADGYIELTDSSASSYAIDLTYAPTGTSYVQILVYVYDDSGNVALYGQTVTVAASHDTEPLVMKNYSYTDDTTAEYNQSETIELPTLVVKDDAIDYVSFVVGVTYTATDGTTTDISVSGYKATNPNNSQYQMKIYGGSFVASYKGTYTAYIAATDDAGNMVVAFSTYKAIGVDVVQTPTLSGLTMEKTQEYELDDFANGDTIEIDTPTVSYEIEDSVTYDKYDSSSSTASTVIMNVNSNGTLTSYNTGYGMSSELDAWSIYRNGGTVSIIYTANVITYEVATFTYVEETYATEGNYYDWVNDNSQTTDAIYVSDEGNYVLLISGSYYVLIEEYDETEQKDVWNLYACDADGSNMASVATTTTGLSEAEITSITSNLKIYHLVSDTYTISVTDTTDPVIADYEYTSIPKSDTDTTYLTVYALQATDADLDIDQCSITISCTLASGSKASKTLSGADAFVDYKEYELARESDDTLIDGTYKIVYTAVDKSGNTSTKTVTIAAGDNTAPTITFSDDFCEDSYEVGTTVTFLLSNITFYDASGIYEDSITYTLTNSSGEEITNESASDEKLVYTLTDADTYTLTVYVEDNVGWSTTETKSFTVEAKSTDSTSVYQVVGIILIVVSVLVLVGVIVYFIVSKVKLDKELKK